MPDAVAVSSGNGIRLAPPALLDRLRPLPCFAVGAATAKVAREAGFADVLECGGDARALAATVTATVRRGSTLAYPCGRVRRPELEATLGEAGLRVEAIETYDTVALTYAEDDLALRIGGEPVAAVLFHAATSAEAFLALPGGDTVGRLFRDARLVCISERVAEVLRAGGCPDVEASAIPTDDAMMDLLTREPR